MPPESQHGSISGVKEVGENIRGAIWISVDNCSPHLECLWLWIISIFGVKVLLGLWLNVLRCQVLFRTVLDLLKMIWWGYGPWWSRARSLLLTAITDNQDMIGFGHHHLHTSPFTISNTWPWNTLTVKGTPEQAHKLLADLTKYLMSVLGLKRITRRLIKINTS